MYIYKELSSMQETANIPMQWNYMMQCGICPDKDVCPCKSEDKEYCVFETKLFRDFVESLDANYSLKSVHRFLIEQVIYNLIISQRIARRLKIDGLQQDVKITDLETGKSKEFKVEHILKQGLHLDLSRVLRMLRELKLTPKEENPKESKVIQDVRDAFKDNLEVIIRKKKSTT